MAHPRISLRRLLAITAASSALFTGAAPGHAQSAETAAAEEDPVATPSTTPLERGVFELVVNDRRAGESIVLLRGEEILVPMDDLRGAGIVRLRMPVEVHDGITYVSMREASAHLRYTLDMDALAIRVEAPASVLGSSTIDMATRAPEGMRYTSDPSVFLNYAPRLIDGQRIEGFGELGVSHGPFLARGTMSHDPDHGPVRLLTQIVFDEQASRTRVIVGDSVASSGPLGGGVMLGGVFVATNMDLDPYLVRIPTLGFSGGVTSPSTLEVYVNDTLVRSVALAPGDFQLANVAPVAGAGSTRYVIRDALGHEQRVQSSYYATSGVLAPGLHEYGYAIGFEREKFGVESLAYGRPALVARHRYGFAREVTAGARLELDGEQASGGLAVTIAPGLGELEIAVSASGAWDGHAGVAGLVGYSYQGRPFSMASVIRLASPEYTTVSLGVDDDRLVLEHATTASLALNASSSIAVRVVYAFARDHVRPVVQFGGDVSTRLTSELNLTVGWSSRHNHEGEWEHQLMAALRVSLPEHHSASIGARVASGGEVDAYAQLSMPITGRTGFGYQVVGGLGTSERLIANVRGRSGIGTLEASYSNIAGESHLIVRGGVGVVFVPGDGLFLRDPTEQSAAVVHVPGVSGVRIQLNNQDVGRTDPTGRLLVSGLTAYQANRVRLDAVDLPLDYDLDEQEQIVAPTQRGVARVTFAARRVRIVRGRIAVGAGPDERWARYGDLDVSGGERSWTSPLGVGGEFELDGVPPGEWRATVRSPQATCELTLTVPDVDQLFVDVGILRCPQQRTETAP